MRELSKGHEQRNAFVCSCGTPEERRAKRREVNPHGVTIEQLLWTLSQIGYGVEIVSDQWFGVIVAGKYGKLDEDDEATYEDAVEFRTYVQCDELDLGLMKTWELWAERFASINNGRRPWAHWEPVIDETDLRVDVYRDGGVRISPVSLSPLVVLRHLPTGLVTQCDTEKSTLLSKEKALAELREQLRQRLRGQGDGNE